MGLTSSQATCTNPKTRMDVARKLYVIWWHGTLPTVRRLPCSAAVPVQPLKQFKLALQRRTESQ